MKYQNGQPMSEAAYKRAALREFHNARAPKPGEDTDYVRKLKERMSARTDKGIQPNAF